jgi:hypothetical protein
MKIETVQNPYLKLNFIFNILIKLNLFYNIPKGTQKNASLTVLLLLAISGPLIQSQR